MVTSSTRLFFKRIHWARFALFTAFLGLYAWAISELQDVDKSWAEWIVGSLAITPGVIFGLIGLRVFKSEEPV